MPDGQLDHRVVLAGDISPVRAVPPQTSVFGRSPLYRAYGWTEELETDTGRWVPLRQPIGYFRWKWMANRATRRWKETRHA